MIIEPPDAEPPRFRVGFLLWLTTLVAASAGVFGAIRGGLLCLLVCSAYAFPWRKQLLIESVVIAGTLIVMACLFYATDTPTDRRSTAGAWVSGEFLGQLVFVGAAAYPLLVPSIFKNRRHQQTE